MLLPPSPSAARNTPARDTLPAAFELFQKVSNWPEDRQPNLSVCTDIDTVRNAISRSAKGITRNMDLKVQIEAVLAKLKGREHSHYDQNFSIKRAKDGMDVKVILAGLGDDIARATY
jgi:hypothetical protein